MHFQQASFPGALPAYASGQSEVPPAFRGVWKRTLLAVPGQPDDRQSIVFWLQTSDWHGDLRLPPARPDFSQQAVAENLSPEQLAWLARQQGFAGFTEVRPADHQSPLGLPAAEKSAALNAPWVEWHRRFDLQPDRGTRDLGVTVLSADGNTLEEYGVDSDYHETWERLPGSAHGHGAWWRGGDDGAPPSAAHSGSPDRPPSELLLVAGDWFYHLRLQPSAPAAGKDLRAETPASGSSRPLGLTLSFGAWEAAKGIGLVQHSSAPWEEGRRIVLGASWRDWKP